MANLHWQETGSRDAPASNANPWFAVALGLMGVIVGFAAGSWRSTGTFIPGAAPKQVAQAPAPTPLPTPQPTPATGPLQPIDPKVNHIRGNLAKATVAVVEYSDFECPFCKRVHPTYQQIMQTYGDTVVWVYRHFPLGFHANAQKEAEASDCAAEQGKFWEYTDKIFERTTSNGTGFPLDNLVPLAKELGLNEATFKNCLDTGKYAKHVQDEETSGQTAGVNGTPGNFVVNLKTQKNQMISGAQPFSSFQSAIDAALKS